MALHATLHPDTSKALYFVARGDGSSAFSETLEAHNAAVNRYQRGATSKPSTEAISTRGINNTGPHQAPSAANSLKSPPPMPCRMTPIIR